MAISWVESQVFGRPGTGAPSSATRGVRNRRRSKVIRHGVLKGLDDTVASYRAALDFCQANWASFDPIEQLPRQTIRVVKLSGDKALTTATYSLTPGVDIDNLNAMERADSEPAKVSVPWYSTHKVHNGGNYPSTSWADVKDKHRYLHNVSTWRFIAHMDYGSSPLTAAIRNMRDRVNDATFSVGGIVWPQFLVRFDAPHINVVRVGAYTLYTTDWAFSVREDGWWQERRSDDGEQILDDRMYDTASFAIPTGFTP